MRICIVYDCLYPWTVGGAERWYRNLAERLSSAGHEVTYLTHLQWKPGAEPELPGVRVVPVSSFAESVHGARAPADLPPIAFGVGVFRHLARHGADYDVVHTASFPYFHLLAAAALRTRRAFGCSSTGTRSGRVDTGTRISARWAAASAPPFSARACAFRSRRSASRGFTSGVSATAAFATRRSPRRAIHRARRRTERRRRPVCRRVRRTPCGGEGRIGARPCVCARARTPRRAAPRRLWRRAATPDVLRQIERFDLGDVVSAPGFVDDQVLDQALRQAICLVLPSRREGYGLVVVEAAANGVPSVVVAGPDNAAVELVEEGVNGAIATSTEPGDLAAAIVRAHDLGPSLRRSTTEWYDANASRLSLDASLAEILRVYADV